MRIAKQNQHKKLEVENAWNIILINNFEELISYKNVFVYQQINYSTHRDIEETS